MGNPSIGDGKKRAESNGQMYSLLAHGIPTKPHEEALDFLV